MNLIATEDLCPDVKYIFVSFMVEFSSGTKGNKKLHNLNYKYSLKLQRTCKQLLMVVNFIVYDLA